MPKTARCLPAKGRARPIDRSLHDSDQRCPISISHVQVGMADATGVHLDQNLIRLGVRSFDFLDRETLFGVTQDSSFHCVSPRGIS
jgi:hypothetical protein